MSTSTPTEVDPEHKHYKEIIHSFRDYANWMSVEAARRERHLANLSDKHKALLPSSAFDAKLEALRLALATNAAFLNFVADEQDISGFGLQFHHDHDHSECDHEHHNHGGDSGHSHGSGESNSGSVGAAANSSSGSTSTNKPTSSPSHYSKVKSTLHQLVRDWSAEGAAERDASYAPLITELQRALPVTPKNKNKQRVLVPGCGLGRLMYDLCAAGYAAQGNEFSLQMLFTAHVMLNVVSERECVTIHPWIHDASNHLRAEDMLRPVHVPDVVPAKLTSLNPGADMSMTAGEFIEIYSKPEHAGAFDAVITCFFIDTAPVAMEYIEVIRHVLRPGGVWINGGPLSFHWQAPDQEVESEASLDSRYGRSVELSYQEIRFAIVNSGFKMLKESTFKTTYAANKLSLMKLLYTTVNFTAVKI